MQGRARVKFGGLDSYKIAKIAALLYVPDSGGVGLLQGLRSQIFVMCLSTKGFEMF